MSKNKSLILILLMVALAPFYALADAKGSDIQLRGCIVEINHKTVNSATLLLQLFDIKYPVIITSSTVIEGDGDFDLTVADLKVGQCVKVDGNLSMEAIVAKEVEVENEEDDFRLSGVIQSTSPSPGGVVIFLHRIPVLVSADTKMEGRESARQLTPDDLSAGQRLDVRGTVVNDQLVATRVKLGERTSDGRRHKLDFEGKITSINGSLLKVKVLDNGLEALVIITEETQIKGALALGVEVHVKGYLNERLQVVATQVTVEGSREREAEEREREGEGNEWRSEIRLESTRSLPRARGEAEIKLEREGETTRQELTVEVKKLAAHTSYRIWVEVSGSFRDFGELNVDDKGDGKARYACPPREERNLCEALPAGKTVRDFGAMEIRSRSDVVLRGRFGHP